MYFDKTITIDGILQVFATLMAVIIAASIPRIIERAKNASKSIRTYKLIKELVINSFLLKDWQIKKTIDILMNDEDLLYFFGIFRLSFDELKEFKWFTASQNQSHKQWARLLFESEYERKYVLCYSFDGELAGLKILPPFKPIKSHPLSPNMVYQPRDLNSNEIEHLLLMIESYASKNKVKIQPGNKLTRFLISKIDKLKDRKSVKGAILEVKKILLKLKNNEKVNEYIHDKIRGKLIYALNIADARLSMQTIGTFNGIENKTTNEIFCIYFGDKYEINETGLLKIKSDEKLELSDENISEFLNYWKSKITYRFRKKIWEWS
ncbi:MAG: hypothetical protein JW870_16785 [Candidatus Delongbacteria bacterium]|nr:hypothetical protein [Candidatus Delongbacteria bacterium]